jgi:hypothetical protein
MTRKAKLNVGVGFVGAAVVIIAARMVVDSGARVVPPDAPPADLVAFTATPTFAKLPVDEQIRYLQAWQMTPAEKRDAAVAQFADRPDVLIRSTALSSDAVRVHQAMNYFAMPDPQSRKQMLDLVIDSEDRMKAFQEKAVKEARKRGDDVIEVTGAQLGQPEVRKFLLENTSPEGRMYAAAFVAEIRNRREQRGLQVD